MVMSQIDPNTRLSELQRIIREAKPNNNVRVWVRSIVQSMNAEGYNVTEEEALLAMQRVV